jgi:hypothetical protein
MLRLIETASSALTAASFLAAALGFAVVGKPMWADEPLPPSPSCTACNGSGCPECPDEGDELDCFTDEDQGCGCSCESEVSNRCENG